jgi:predicted permease
VLVGAGLLVRTLQNLKDIDPGFDTRNLLTFTLDTTLAGYNPSRGTAFLSDLRQRIAAVPGVESVSYAGIALLSGSLSATVVHIQGTPQGQRAPTYDLEIGPSYFSTMRMRLLAGRSFTSADFAQAEIIPEREAAESTAAQAKKAGAAAPSASAEKNAAKSALAPEEESVPAIVNKAFVTKYLAGKNPLGQHIDEGPGYVIVGVVSNAKYASLRNDIWPTLYMPSNGGGGTFEVRTRGNPASLTGTIRGIVSQMDSSLTISDVYTETQLIDQLLVRERMVAQLSGFFGLLALALACVGLYGLLSFEVTRRTREIGIRMALGAQDGDVLRMVVKQGIVLAFIGAALGIGAAIAVTRYLDSFLYGVHAGDPATIMLVATLMVVVALAACYIPARRATKVDPMVALRYE